VRDIVVLGAGPYGLAAAAHLSTIRGLDVAVFGKPMDFWINHMPAGMLLRSNWTATQIADPGTGLTLEEFQKVAARRITTPVPIEGFVAYGQWYQKEGVPGLDKRAVAQILPDGDHFRVVLEDGEAVRSRKVIVAAGIGPFAWRPPELAGIPSSHASHTSEYRKFSGFYGKSVLVVGSGQSALESAALLHESGAQVEVIARSQIHWLQGCLSRALHHGLGKFTRTLLYAPTDVGPAGLSQFVARPYLVRPLPRRIQDRLRKRCVRPAGARWLLQRLAQVPIRTGRFITSAQLAGDMVEVALDDGSARTVDHILLGTGYRVDIDKYRFLAPRLLHAIQRAGGYPILTNTFETSVRGLYMVGAPSAWSFGPLVQFVSGTAYTSRTLRRAFSRKS
jgi:cation diffusion facilitator CzcD-associated flavoprotein CzcO